MNDEMDKQNISASPDSYENAINLQTQDMGELLAQWRDALPPASDPITYPSILITLAVAGLPCALAGFPARLLLIPFLGPCRQISQALYKKLSGMPIENNLILGRARFRKLIDPDKHCSDFTGHGISHWGFDATKSLEDIDDTMQKYIVHIRKWKLVETELEREIRMRQGLFRTLQMVLGPILDLINDFDPRGWAQSFHDEKNQKN